MDINRTISPKSIPETKTNNDKMVATKKINNDQKCLKLSPKNNVQRYKKLDLSKKYSLKKYDKNQ